MNIVILDGATTNPGDLSWDEIEALGHLSVYDNTDARLVLERSINADILITNRVTIDDELLSALPHLKYIGTLGTGYNCIDISSARRHGITVCNVPHYCVHTVSQFTFSLLLYLANPVADISSSLKNEGWESSLGLGYRHFFELSERTIGILGFGNIGKAVAAIALSLGMKVIYHSRSKNPCVEHCEYVSLKELFIQSDIISIHCPLTNLTRGLVNKELISLMQKGSYIVNTSRGAVVNESDIADALNCGHLSGFASDVFSTEPISGENPLLSAKNCILTPHIAWVSRDARMRLISCVAENIRGFILGEIKNNIN